MGELAAQAVPQDEQEERFAFMGQMGEYHPAYEHWYLPLIGVDPPQRGNGLGSALLRHALERADRDHLPAYLEATSPKNKPLYERHGFEEIGVIQFGSSPPMWPMLRKAR
jgi:GNAT superfamily N-acetyltransferase